MAARALKRYALAVMGAAAWTAVHAAVGAGRSMVCTVIVTNNSTSVTQTFYLSVSAADAGGANVFAQSVSLAPGEIYKETGVVVLATEKINVNNNNANGVTVAVYGEELDA